MLKALADRTRLRIIGILLSREACVCDMQAVLGLPQPLLSRHLAYLRSAGLISDRRVGARIYCSLALEGDIGKALREFLQSIMPHFGPFQEDNSRMKAHMERSDWMRRGVTESTQSENKGSAKEVSNGDQSSALQL
jgi:ArsR family transcriptional regulator